MLESRGAQLRSVSVSITGKRVLIITRRMRYKKPGEDYGYVRTTDSEMTYVDLEDFNRDPEGQVKDALRFLLAAFLDEGPGRPGGGAVLGSSPPSARSGGPEDPDADPLF
jgi:Fe-S-cluster formation regulator IscX/YfhJ